MPLRGTRRGERHDVAAWAIAGQAPGIFRNSVWALALAGGRGRGDRIGGGWWLRLDHRWLRLDLRGWRCRLGASRALLPAAAIALGLVPAALFALGGGPVALTGMPAPPAPGGVLAGRATVACLGPLGQEPGFTAFEQATAASRVPTARAGQGAGWLTLRQGEERLSMAHGRNCSRAVRRREGDTSRRHFAPTRWRPVVGIPATRTCQLTCSESRLPERKRCEVR